METNPVSAFVVKIASRCNINCKYCYMYNLADTTWRRQPKFMSEGIYRKFVERIRDHTRTHSIKRIDFILHGGEPLLAGALGLDRYFSIFWEVMDGTGVEPTLGLQTNGLLLSDEIGAVLAKHGASFGVSIDGIPGRGDRFRVDKRGIPTGARLEKRLREFLAGDYAGTFSGFLGVVDLENDPIETFEYLRTFNPPSVDFRLPLDHHDRKPTRSRSLRGAEFGRWYTRLFDHIVNNRIDIRVRFFNGIVQSLTNHPHASRTMGNMELAALVMESDGTYELVDSLKSTYDEATKTGLNVNQHSLDDFVAFRGEWLRKTGAMRPCNECLNCPIFSFCQGGFYVHRYSSKNKFANPDVYCADLKEVFYHIHSRLAA